jgi:catechol 2,3-dioxygenase-like lactoylglutathione lyase family enzyme
MKIRIARATNDFSKVKQFYCDGLGLEVLTSFENHEEFSGLILGIPGQTYQFEFTRENNCEAPRATSEELLWIFYVANQIEWESRIERMIGHGFFPIESNNPYWDRGGKTFEDFEGYRIVLFRG